MQDLNVLTCVRQLAPIASQARHFPPSSGEADAKEERIHSFIILNTLLTISYAGFLPLPLVGYGVSLHFRVALLLKIQFACHRSWLPPLKNDGRSELLCHDILMLNEYIKKSIGNVSCPRLSGKVSTVRLTEGASWSRHKRMEISVRRNEKTIFTERH